MHTLRSQRATTCYLFQSARACAQEHRPRAGKQHNRSSRLQLPLQLSCPQACLCACVDVQVCSRKARVARARRRAARRTLAASFGAWEARAGAGSARARLLFRGVMRVSRRLMQRVMQGWKVRGLHQAYCPSAPVGTPLFSKGKAQPPFSGRLCLVVWSNCVCLNAGSAQALPSIFFYLCCSSGPRSEDHTGASGPPHCAHHRTRYTCQRCTTCGHCAVPFCHGRPWRGARESAACTTLAGHACHHTTRLVAPPHNEARGTTTRLRAWRAV